MSTQPVQSEVSSNPSDVKVLLVDDLDNNLLVLEALLSAEGYHCVKARSGREALGVLLEDDDFAVILLDVQMPGLDGFATAELIQKRERTRYIPIIFVTAAYTEFQHVLRGYRLHAIDYILKPFEEDILLAKVNVLARLYRNTRELARENRERRRLEDALRRSNEDLEQFAYVASHDLKEPLRTVSSFMTLLKDHCQGQLDAKAHEFIDMAVGGAGRMNDRIDALLSYSRLTTRAQAMVAVNLNEVMEQVRNDLAAAIHAEDASVTWDELPVVSAEPTQIGELLMNLVSNAIRFRGSEPPQVAVSATRQKNEWLLAVRDNGIGIDEHFRERIFVMFQRLHPETEYPGSGVGLALCKKIVERHGGKIWVESRPGGGSSFLFTLPDKPATDPAD